MKLKELVAFECFCFVGSHIVYEARGNNWYSSGPYSGGPYHADGDTEVRIWIPGRVGTETDYGMMENL